MSRLTYRPATLADASTIADFQLWMALETEEVTLDPAICRAGVAAVFERPGLGCYHVAEEHGRLLASTLLTYEWSDWRNGVVWWIQSVYVPPSDRRRGIFAGLYRYLQAQAEADPLVRGLRLYVDLRNRSAQEVYTRLGMNGEHYRVFEWMKPGPLTEDE
jgi:ribosomal protein S18 acetylase RimI-like enzyme